ncbi:MAG TPA: phage Gp37/Gp68 family protein [Nevskiales bacterium]|nr:phage Gp37/Gp68 family protein [Nevskiales bacterium]
MIVSDKLNDMGQNSKIEWTHHTFNPWWGCVKVSPACKHCYAETWAQRLGLELWGGDDTQRRFFSDHHWREPLRWEAEARRAGERRRVFCASMADVFEDRADLIDQRARLWPLIEQTPSLDWLLLTKRPENVRASVPWGKAWPRNLWLGTTVEDMKYAQMRIPLIVDMPAAVRFVSCEPLLGVLKLKRWLRPPGKPRGINWVIAGGESGHHSRPMNPLWVEGLRDQCLAAGVPFHFKQWGHWGPASPADRRAVMSVEMPGRNGRPVRLFKLGKNVTGRMLNGRTWDGVPTLVES